jgi:Bacterial Ig-like domain (group 2)
MNLAVPRRAVVMRIPPQWALNNLISLFSLLLLVGCCQFFRGPDEVVSFTISPLNMSIQPGTTQNFSATGTFGLGETKDITSLVKWASSNPARVTIDSAGLATAIANGTVTISGTYECYTTGTSLSVVNQTTAIRSIAITPQTAKVTGDLTQHFSRQQPTRIAPTASSQTRLDGRQVMTRLQPPAP